MPEIRLSSTAPREGRRVLSGFRNVVGNNRQTFHVINNKGRKPLKNE